MDVYEKYYPLIRKMSRKFRVYSIGTVEDHEQWLWELLLQIDVAYLINHPALVKTILSRRLYDYIKRDPQGEAYRNVSIDMVQYEEDNPDFIDHRYGVERMETLLMKRVFREKLNDLVRFLEDEEFQLLHFYLEWLETRDGIPNDRETCRRLYGFFSLAQSSSFRSLKRSLYSKIYNCFTEMIEKDYSFESYPQDGTIKRKYKRRIS